MNYSINNKRSELYFKKCKLFQLMCYEIGGKILCKDAQEEICRKCPHRNDSHGMNCIECCPINRALEKLKKNG